MKETRAYAHLKNKFPLAHWCRIEGYATPGILDVNGCYKKVEVWVELKQFNKPKKTGLIRLDPKKKSVKDQIAWGIRRRQAGGRTFYGLMVDREFILINGAFTAMLQQGVTYDQLQKIETPLEMLFG